MDYEYANEKLALTVEALATGIGGIKERLYNAVTSHFYRLGSGAMDEQLPPSLQKEYVTIIELLTFAEPLHNEGSLKASIDLIPDIEASRIATDIFSLYYKLVNNLY